MAANVDYDNVFVGQYDAGDLQYNDHVSRRNLNLLYWKTSKNFADGCSAHLAGGHFAEGNVALPDQSAFVIERTSFAGHVALEANHHCNVGVTGVLCMPTYVLDRVSWAVQDTPTWHRMFYFNGNDQMKGGIFTLAPPEAIAGNPGGGIFPPTFTSLCSSSFSYLLAIDDGQCVAASSLGLGSRFGDGILCQPELRALRIYTRGMSRATAPRLRVQLYQRGGFFGTNGLRSELLLPLHQVADTKKQGYSLPVVAGLGLSLEYRLALEDGSILPAEWIVEYSDPVFGNRWGVDKLRIQVAGRDCGAGNDQTATIDSQHDRRFLWAGVADEDHLIDASWGHGACTAHPPMPLVHCPATVAPEMPPCEACGDTHCLACNEARCGEHGTCTALHLGGDLGVSRHACICETESFLGPTCEVNPCAVLGTSPCGLHGTCVAADEFSGAWACECDAGHSGSLCEISCDGICDGSYPFGCNDGVEAAQLLCSPGGGCRYEASEAEVADASWCAFKTNASALVPCVGSCNVDDDCHRSECLNGQCTAPLAVPDGTVCHSLPWGACAAGVCVAGVASATAATDNSSCLASVIGLPRFRRPDDTPPSREWVRWGIALLCGFSASLLALLSDRVHTQYEHWRDGTSGESQSKSLLRGAHQNAPPMADEPRQVFVPSVGWMSEDAARRFKAKAKKRPQQPWLSQSQKEALALPDEPVLVPGVGYMSPQMAAKLGPRPPPVDLTTWGPDAGGGAAPPVAPPPPPGSGLPPPPPPPPQRPVPPPPKRPVPPPPKRPPPRPPARPPGARPGTPPRSGPAQSPHLVSHAL